ncbi:hypothetical protein DFP72DRAFT_1079916 [Ephemerocybe angulata]|uniref:Urease n=1 Tax=Ephemerocybe angulata TaxID=980116 RepID=A0A8H6LTR6_9AGAR|nr:hypothetical protein DFP72DRAFT_1079916 [Tulosesus angulatus]
MLPTLDNMRTLALQLDVFDRVEGTRKRVCAAHVPRCSGGFLVVVGDVQPYKKSMDVGEINGGISSEGACVVGGVDLRTTVNILGNHTRPNLHRGDLTAAPYASFFPIPSNDLFPILPESECALQNLPGALILKKERIQLNQGRHRVKVRVMNNGDRPIQVGSHYHFIETNRASLFDRGKAYGQRWQPRRHGIRLAVPCHWLLHGSHHGGSSRAHPLHLPAAGRGGFGVQHDDDDWRGHGPESRHECDYVHPSPFYMRHTLQATDGLPMSFAFTGKGTDAAPHVLEGMGATGLHEDRVWAGGAGERRRPYQDHTHV